MATVLESPFLSSRLRQIEERYEQPTTFGKCDCTSYSYLVLSVILFTFGTAITIVAVGDIVDKHVFAQLGHMWLMGPIFICCGLMVAIKCMLYLRRKSVIQLIFQQRQLFRQFHEYSHNGVQGITSASTLAAAPPSYEFAISSHNQGPSDIQPPTYAEAVALIAAGVNDAKPCTVADTTETGPSKP